MLVLLDIPVCFVQSLLSLASLFLVFLSLVPLAFLTYVSPPHRAGCERDPCGGQRGQGSGD